MLICPVQKIKVWKHMSEGLSKVKDCQFGVSPVNYSDSDSECHYEKKIDF